LKGKKRKGWLNFLIKWFVLLQSFLHISIDHLLIFALSYLFIPFLALAYRPLEFVE